MSKRASPAMVGTFVIAGIVLALIGVVAIGGGRLFRDTARLIVYFDGSVGGLRIGAPVKFRGIEVGSVKDVRINMSGALRDPLNIRIPVVIEIDVGRVTSHGVQGIDLHDRAQVRALVDRGLRAELGTESFVTGLRYVSLDVKPGTPAALVNSSAVPYPEIPSLRSPMEDAPEKLNQILTKLADVDVAQIAKSVQATADEARDLLGSPHLRRAVAALDELTASMKRTVTDLETTARDLHPVLTSAHRLVAPEGQLSTQVDATLKEMAAAARATRRLADQLSRDPGSLLRGGRQ